MLQLLSLSLPTNVAHPGIQRWRVVVAAINRRLFQTEDDDLFAIKHQLRLD